MSTNMLKVNKTKPFSKHSSANYRQLYAQKSGNFDRAEFIWTNTKVLTWDFLSKSHTHIFDPL